MAIRTDSGFYDRRRDYLRVLYLLVLSIQLMPKHKQVL